MKKLLAITLITAIAAITALCLLAAPQPALAGGGTGSLEVIVQRTNNPAAPLANFEVRVWRVADVGHLLDPAAPIAPFAGAAVADWGADITNTAAENRDMAAALLAYVNQNNIPYTHRVAATGANGRAVFSDLPFGLYLVALRDNNSPVRYNFQPFMARVPFAQITQGLLFEVRDVVAIPKGTPVTPPPGGNGYTNGGNGGGYTNGGGFVPQTPPFRHGGGVQIGDGEVPFAYMDPEYELDEDPVPLADLPQTGALRWPAPLLSMCGLSLVTLGAG